MYLFRRRKSGLAENRLEKSDPTERGTGESREKTGLEAAGKEDFVMTVRDVFKVIGIGTAAAGVVERGRCRKGDRGIIVGGKDGKEFTAGRIYLRGKGRKKNDEACEGEDVSIQLKGADIRVETGDKLIIKR